MTTASRNRVAAICAGLPGAEMSDPRGGGHDAWKVGGKMFACIGGMLPGVAVKCADIDTASMPIGAGIGSRARYFHRSGALLPEDVAADELQHRLVTAYDLIRGKLPKKVRAALPDRPGAGG